MARRAKETVFKDLDRWETELNIVKNELAQNPDKHEYNLAIYAIQIRIAKLYKELASPWTDQIQQKAEKVWSDFRQRSRPNWNVNSRPLKDVFPPVGSWVRVVSANGQVGGEIGILRDAGSPYYMKVEIPGKRAMRSAIVSPKEVMVIEEPSDEVKANYLTYKVL